MERDAGQSPSCAGGEQPWRVASGHLESGAGRSPCCVGEGPPCPVSMRRFCCCGRERGGGVGKVEGEGWCDGFQVCTVCQGCVAVVD